MKNNGQKGGAEKVIPQYVEPKFNPGVPNQQKEINAQRYGEQQTVMEKYKGQAQDKQLINLQVYQPSKPKPEPSKDINFFPSFNTNPYFPAQMSNMFAPFGSSMLGSMYPMAVNVNKIYEILTTKPADSGYILYFVKGMGSAQQIIDGVMNKLKDKYDIIFPYFALLESKTKQNLSDFALDKKDY